MSSDSYQPAPGIRRMLCGTQPILSLRALKAALDVFDDVDLAAAASQEPRAYRPVHGSASSQSAAAFGLAHHTPRDRRRAAATSRSLIEHGYEVVQALIERGIIGDFRAPDIMRFGFTPLYLRYRDVLDAAAALADILRTRRLAANRVLPSVLR